MSKKSYLLDTDTIIDLIRRRYNLWDKVTDVGFHRCSVSEITIAELHYGVQFSPNIEKHKDEPYDVQKLFNVSPISEVLELFGQEKAYLRRNGNLIADHDLWIGTTSVQHGLIMVTSNIKHFKRIRNIELEDWRDPTFNHFLK